MAIQPVPAAPAALPFPGLNEKAAGTYNATAFAWGNQMPAYADGIKALGDNVHNNATETKSTADAVADLAQEVEAARDLTLVAAAAAVQAPGAMATSTTSMAVGGGTKVFTLVQADKDFAPGQTVVSAYTPNPTINMLCLVLAYDKPTKQLTLSVTVPSGAGTYADWTISVSAGQTPLPRYAYADRGLLRTAGGAPGAGATVEGLGLFIYAPGSDEPDDDETCFATGLGCWLLEAASLDLVDAWLAPALDALSTNTSFLHGAGNCPLTSVSTNAVASFNLSIAGAEIGDRVLLSPPGPMGATVSFYGRVTGLDTVTVYLANGAAASGSAMAGTWGATVFKEIQ